VGEIPDTNVNGVENKNEGGADFAAAKAKEEADKLKEDEKTSKFLRER